MCIRDRFEGIEFGNTSGKLVAKLIVEAGEVAGQKEYITFKGEGLDLVPGGIAGINARLSLEEVESLAGLRMPLELLPYNNNGTTESGSYVSCDCDGLQAFNLEGNYIFDEDFKYVKEDGSIDEETEVKAGFTINTEEWGEFIGQTNSICLLYTSDAADE